MKRGKRFFELTNLEACLILAVGVFIVGFNFGVATYLVLLYNGKPFAWNNIAEIWSDYSNTTCTITATVGAFGIFYTCLVLLYFAYEFLLALVHFSDVGLYVLRKMRKRNSPEEIIRDTVEASTQNSFEGTLASGLA